MRWNLAKGVRLVQGRVGGRREDQVKLYPAWQLGQRLHGGELGAERLDGNGLQRHVAAILGGLRFGEHRPAMPALRCERVAHLNHLLVEVDVNPAQRGRIANAQARDEHSHPQIFVAVAAHRLQQHSGLDH
jgi:hypothetical protein